VLAFIYDTPLLHKDNTLAYWMLQAVQSLTEKTIGFLTPEDAAALSSSYREAYPKTPACRPRKKSRRCCRPIG
jgi:hypothetical protein